MKINYKETTSDLQTRINIHDQFGGRNIDEWMLSILPLKPGISILDVACGSGKQCFSYYNHLKGNVKIIGGDVSKDLLAQAAEANHKIGDPMTFVDLDFNKPFQFSDNTFDMASCCFAIYYAEDVPFTIKEMHRVLKPGGTLFTSGPMPANKQLFYDIIKEATHKTIPPMPGSSRYSTEFLTTIRNTFSKVDVQIFENPLTFTEAKPFVDYTRASLSEDRKLWGDFFKEKGDFEKIMTAIQEVANRRIEKEGKLVMTKVVGGFLAVK
jgi:ubiquinone/menaquinone biosynthesis C-methylase UbiE